MLALGLKIVEVAAYGYFVAQVAAMKLGMRRAPEYAEKIIAIATLAHPNDPDAAWEYVRVHYHRIEPASWNPVTTYREEATFYGASLALSHFLEELKRANACECQVGRR